MQVLFRVTPDFEVLSVSPSFEALIRRCAPPSPAEREKGSEHFGAAQLTCGREPWNIAPRSSSLRFAAGPLAFTSTRSYSQP